MNRRQLLRFGLLAPFGASLHAASQDPESPSSFPSTSHPEVRQLVTFKLAPGKTSEVIAAFRDQALPLYKKNEAMRRFRGYREVESPVPLDLIVVSSFTGMAGMDASNERLRALATEANTSIGKIYGTIGSMSVSHQDQFVEMIDGARVSSAESTALTVFESIELATEDNRAFERTLIEEITPWERESRILGGSETGRMLIGSGWHYLRFLGIERLATLQNHLGAMRERPFYRKLAPSIRRYQRIVAGILPELSVR